MKATQSHNKEIVHDILIVGAGLAGTWALA